MLTYKNKSNGTDKDNKPTRFDVRFTESLTCFIVSLLFLGLYLLFK